MRRVVPVLCVMSAVFSAVLLPMAVRAENACRYRADRAAEASADGIRKIVVEVGAGSLDIRGEPGRQRIEASGEACAPDEESLEHLQIHVERRFGTLVISTKPPMSIREPSSWFGGGDRGDGRLDISIKVPAGIAVDVEDGSGDARISNVGDLDITDGSGSLHIENVDGSVDLLDGSGDVTIARVRGSVSVKDGSGEIEIEQVTGDVKIPNDGSGGIAIVDVQGSVTIGNDGSGDIRIERVGGSVKIGNDGSGEIRISHVKRDVTVDHDGSGAIVVEDVDGDLSIGEHGSGGVRHARIGGSVSVRGNDR